MQFPRHWPLVPTILVALAALCMVGLGIWQIQRHVEKRALLDAVTANVNKPAMIWPVVGPVAEEALFRRSSLYCLRVVEWSKEAGRAADGSAGYRYIAHCSAGVEGPGALVVAGVSPRMDAAVQWNGGPMSGYIVEEPDRRSLITRIFDRKWVARPMLIATQSPDKALKTPARPDAAAIPNNHMAYALQWFIFAALAVVIYGFALARKQQVQGKGDS